KANQVDVYAGKGIILDSNNLQVGEETLNGKNILIAAGSVPAVPPIKGVDLDGVVTSDAILDGAGLDYTHFV
ncbi:MAG: dihydrolipoyl dehydrogenase, partial [Clostridia bacterium]|nr:dihydrolipoyl dehydrogenase [Clostridia bacterium]